VCRCVVADVTAVFAFGFVIVMSAVVSAGMYVALVVRTHIGIEIVVVLLILNMILDL